jgi:hypothetical protein
MQNSHPALNLSSLSTSLYQSSGLVLLGEHRPDLRQGWGLSAGPGFGGKGVKYKEPGVELWKCRAGTKTERGGGYLVHQGGKGGQSSRGRVSQTEGGVKRSRGGAEAVRSRTDAKRARDWLDG